MRRRVSQELSVLPPPVGGPLLKTRASSSLTAPNAPLASTGPITRLYGSASAGPRQAVQGEALTTQSASQQEHMISRSNLSKGVCRKALAYSVDKGSF